MACAMATPGKRRRTRRGPKRCGRISATSCASIAGRTSATGKAMADSAAHTGQDQFTSGKPLPAALLHRRCAREELPFALSSELADAPAPLGQARATEAVEFALRMRHKGYNVYALGPAGTGRHDLVEDLLRRRAMAESIPPDLCY